MEFPSGKTLAEHLVITGGLWVGPESRPSFTLDKNLPKRERKYDVFIFYLKDGQDSASKGNCIADGPIGNFQSNPRSK